jgi:hypothetical protein
MKIGDPETSWEQGERAWEEGAARAAASHPIKKLAVLPQMPGIAEKHLKFKSLMYLIFRDSHHLFRRFVFKHPFRYAARYIASIFRNKSYVRDGDFFLYNIPDVEAFKQQLKKKESLFVIGFSYCHKPFECPSGRFTDQCRHDPEHPVCRQCFIGKAMNALPDSRCVPLFIPTVHYIGEKMFELSELHPDKKILFLITACEMTLEMFGDWGNMLGIRGIGVRLDGRICNTMKAFDLSERGIKPGLTVVLDPTQKRILDIIRFLREDAPCETAWDARPSRKL